MTKQDRQKNLKMLRIRDYRKLKIFCKGNGSIEHEAIFSDPWPLRAKKGDCFSITHIVGL